MQIKGKKIQSIYLIFWVMLLYVVASLIWWYIALNRQNNQMFQHAMQEISLTDILYSKKVNEATVISNKNKAQYFGEGVTFLLLILGGGFFILRLLKRELKQTKEQRNFMMAVTHELKTPIAVAKLNLETIQKHTLKPEQQQKLLSNTLLETNRLDNLCNNLLVSSQLESDGYKIVREKISLTDCINECVIGIKSRYSQRAFISSIEDGIEITGDYFLIQMAMSNLIENALKYSPKEKSIIIKLFSDNNLAVVNVIDEGNGIADIEKKLVFKKYYRIGNEATKSAKGTGLGLYLVSNIIKSHRGNISIEDNIKGGSVFSFVLNRAI